MDRFCLRCYCKIPPSLNIIISFFSILCVCRWRNAWTFPFRPVWSECCVHSLERLVPGLWMNQFRIWFDRRVYWCAQLRAVCGRRVKSYWLNERNERTTLNWGGHWGFFCCWRCIAIVDCLASISFCGFVFAFILNLWLLLKIFYWIDVKSLSLSLSLCFISVFFP